MDTNRKHGGRTAPARTPPAGLERCIEAMRAAVADGKPASVTEIAHRDRDPFRVLIATIFRELD